MIAGDFRLFSFCTFKGRSSKSLPCIWFKYPISCCPTHFCHHKVSWVEGCPISCAPPGSRWICPSRRQSQCEGPVSSHLVQYRGRTAPHRPTAHACFLQVNPFHMIMVSFVWYSLALKAKRVSCVHGYNTKIPTCCCGVYAQRFQCNTSIFCTVQVNREVWRPVHVA